jgi:hypothetical protein
MYALQFDLDNTYTDIILYHYDIKIQHKKVCKRIMIENIMNI